VAWLSAFNAQDNGITSARFVLASLVIASHSVAIGGFGPEPLVAETGATLGFLAVIAFFTLSGFLLAGSRERSDVVPFVRNRLLRILPGYWVALVFGAIVALMFGASVESATNYVASNVPLLFQGRHGTDAFGGGPINGSLWSLRIEIVAYISLVLVPRRWLRPVALGEFVILLPLALDRTGDTALLLAFAFGVCAWLWRNRIPMIPILAIPAFLAGNAFAWPLAVIACGYLGIAMSRLPWRLERDLSYGMYVLAYPVQLAIATASLPLPIMVAASFAVVVPLAFLSWTFIEAPALRLRGRHADADQLDGTGSARTDGMAASRARRARQRTSIAATIAATAGPPCTGAARTAAVTGVSTGIAISE
jgi:peptidoglycan/LPS O-acetylase OafA/YrhL